MIELRNYMYECFCNKYDIRHFYNPFTCEIIYYPSNDINNNFYSKRCKYFLDNSNLCKNSCCHYKHLKDIELPIENDITDTLIERHTSSNGEIGWKIIKPIEPSYNVIEPIEPIESRYNVMESIESIEPSYDPIEPSYDPIEPSYDPIELIEPSYNVMESIESIEPSYNLKDPIEPIEPSYDPIKQKEITVYEPINKQTKLLPETTKVCCHYHNKYRPKNEMIKEYINDNKIIWICPYDNQCKIVTIM